MARPTKAPQEKRDNVLGVRFTTAERAEVDLNAFAPGISPADFTRRRTLGYRVPAAAAVQQGQALLGSAFNRLAVNMNQIAYKLGSGERPSVVERELQTLIDRINAESRRRCSFFPSLLACGGLRPIQPVTEDAPQCRCPIL